MSRAKIESLLRVPSFFWKQPVDMEKNLIVVLAIAMVKMMPATPVMRPNGTTFCGVHGKRNRSVVPEKGDDEAVNAPSTGEHREDSAQSIENPTSKTSSTSPRRTISAARNFRF
jgi:hypothetical protein